MSDQGFHEVQLSGKQLVFLFMSAVVLMVVVFLLGVNVGRGVRGAVGDTDVSAQADADESVTPDAAAESAPAGAKPAQPELSYHDMLLAATPAADKGAGADKTPPAEAPPPVSEEPPPAPRTSPTPTPTPTPAPPAATAAPKAAGRGDWFLQTGAYSTKAVADGQVAKLKQLNVPAFVLPPESGGTSFRVRIGPYADRAEADKVKSRIARQGFPSLITR